MEKQTKQTKTIGQIIGVIAYDMDTTHTKYGDGKGVSQVKGKIDLTGATDKEVHGLLTHALRVRFAQNHSRKTDPTVFKKMLDGKTVAFNWSCPEPPENAMIKLGQVIAKLKKAGYTDEMIEKATKG